MNDLITAPAQKAVSVNLQINTETGIAKITQATFPDKCMVQMFKDENGEINATITVFLPDAEDA
jgi:hypothetical protein